MSSIAASERTLLCALAQQLGPDAPTLCDGWTVEDLIVHLLVREGSLASVGLVVPPLRGALERAAERRKRADFADLVKRLRHGPPLWSPFALPKVGALLNTVEYFVHHEDIRRAQPGWQPRVLPARLEDALWRLVRPAARGLLARSPVGVVAERTDTGSRATLHGGSPQVVVRGRPSEITLFVYGRQDHARVELSGDEAAVAALRDARLGI